MQNESFFCRYCPCVWCDGNEDGNRAVTGYGFVPDPDHCKQMFQRETEISYDIFLQAIFEIYGSTVNTDWHRFLIHKNIKE